MYIHWKRLFNFGIGIVIIEEKKIFSFLVLIFILWDICSDESKDFIVFADKI